MRICPNCSAQNFDTNTECEKCNYPLRVSPFRIVVPMTTNNTAGEAQTVFDIKSKAPNGLQTTAFVFLLISSIFAAMGWLTVFVAWMISVYFPIGIFSTVFLILTLLTLPQVAVSIYVTYVYRYETMSDIKVGLAFKIVTLILINTVAGILMLCDHD